ncbi:Peroxisome biogenesis protein 6 [Abeliophyllum distichum]|uniref:Peroxisome biogenesis protein 6 n=1 Tax=Abeliophyllum distichum TaxID=126358 RepID=A0ABD1VTB7_9LAMI
MVPDCVRSWSHLGRVGDVYGFIRGHGGVFSDISGHEPDCWPDQLVLVLYSLMNLILLPLPGCLWRFWGVMDRVVSQMLAEIDGLNDSTQDLFIIGASNRPDLIDPALLRPGRFDKLLYVGVNSEATYRERVLKALTRKFKLHEDVLLYEIAKKCPPNFTGADMYALCADAWFHAAKRKVLVADSDSTDSPDHPDSIVVEYEDFLKVLGELSPSLSMVELRKYELLRDQFQGSSR